MSTAEEQELMARISNLAGRINRHKSQSTPTIGPNQSHYPARGSYRTAPYPRGGYRGGRGQAPVYRNKTLLVNTHSQPTATCEPEPRTNESNGSWVTKNGRNLALINSTVYDESPDRAMEQSRRQKQFHIDRTEKKHVSNYLRQNGSRVSAVPGTSNQSPVGPNLKYEITVDGIRFEVTREGSKLVRALDNPPSSTPRITAVGGVTFHRTKNGNLVRHSIAKAYRMAAGVKKVNVPCKAFSWTGIVFFPNYGIANLATLTRLWCGKTPKALSDFFLGSCQKGPLCRYLHDPSKVAICRDWLLKGQCQDGDTCDLVHETTPERTPLCLHFAKGKCNNDSCPYVHAQHSQTDPVCRAFGTCGYCEKGADCPDRHVFECPDFSNTGVCKTKGCRLAHRERASVLRKAGTIKQEEMDDLSSDEEVTGGDDIDSDEVEEFIGVDEVDNMDFANQKDFIGF